MVLWHFALRNLASDAGLLAKNSNYVPFILLGRSRTGSNLLRDLLNAHSQVIVFGEIFRHYGEIGWDFSYLPQTKRMRSLIEQQPARFLERWVYGNPPPHLQAVGFKLFYYHAQSSAWRPVWTYLAEQEDLKVIHVKRKNILKTHLSRKKAMRTNSWVSKSPSPAKRYEPIALDYQECLEDFTKTRAWEQRYDSLFAQHQKIDVLYEDLAGDYRVEMARVQEFLGIEYADVEPRTVKQSRRPLSTTILNYAELKEQFANTIWEEFFDA